MAHPRAVPHKKGHAMSVVSKRFTGNSLLVLACSAALTLAACSKKEAAEAPKEAAPAAADAMANTNTEGQLDIVAWPGYIERGESDKAYDWVTKFEADTKGARETMMGNMQKVIIPFRRDIFRGERPNSWVLYEGDLLDEERKQLNAADGKPRVMAFVIKPLNTNIAIGFFGGDRARALEEQCQGKENGSGPRSKSGCDDLAIKITTSALSKIYGDDPVKDSIQSNQIHVTRWSLDETSLGAYSVPVPGYWDKREILRRPVGVGEDGEGTKRLFFAGEGAARAIHNGSYPGAYESGVEAARGINAEMIAKAGQKRD